MDVEQCGLPARIMLIPWRHEVNTDNLYIKFSSSAFANLINILVLLSFETDLVSPQGWQKSKNKKAYGGLHINVIFLT